MSLNQTPSGERVHIGFFGRRNAGKSSIVNAITGQDMAVVSETKGTTTDPVKKAMELLPIGPAMIIDTPGFDDEGALGEQRMKKTRQILNRTDIAVLVVDGTEGIKDCDYDLMKLFQEKEIPYLIVYNKKDQMDHVPEDTGRSISVSALCHEKIEELKDKIASMNYGREEGKRLVADLVQPFDFVVLVIPIDSAAPKGRLILPQQQVLRDVLDAGGTAVCVKDAELRETLSRMGRSPALVVTDSQAFKEVSSIVPEEIMLTSFSILMARYKGFLEQAVKGAAAIERLEDGDRVLIAEGCTHHRQCDDIGTVKLPRWLKQYTGKDLKIDTSSGLGFPEDLSPYALILHCGGCMLNEREVRYRMKSARDQGTAVTNYGAAIAYMQGILERSLRVFPGIWAELIGRQIRDKRTER